MKNDIVSMLKQSSNPQQLLQNMARANPQVASVLQEVQANGGDARSLFYRKAQQMGIDPQAVLNQLK